MVTRMHADDLDLKALRESMTNSLQLYVKTRHQAGMFGEIIGSNDDEIVYFVFVDIYSMYSVLRICFYVRVSLPK